MSGPFPVYDGPVTVRASASADGVCQLRLDVPAQLRTVRPGQYVLLRAADGPFLPRPLSILSVDDGLAIVANLWGPGTQAIAAVPVGGTLNLTGPLGNGFSSPAQPITMVTDLSHIGGVLALALVRRRPDDTLLIVSDAERERAVLSDLLGGAGVAYRFVASSEIVPAIANTPAPLAVSTVDRVAQAIQSSAAASGRTGEVLLHAVMACGLGACHACVHPMRGAAPALVCDGPVFDLQAPDFSALLARAAA